MLKETSVRCFLMACSLVNAGDCGTFIACFYKCLGILVALDFPRYQSILKTLVTPGVLG